MCQLTQLMMPFRGGWKGKPVVVLGRKEDVPMGLLPLVSIVARPVKHARLVTALLKATALMRSKAQVSADQDSHPKLTPRESLSLSLPE